MSRPAFPASSSELSESAVAAEKPTRLERRLLPPSGGRGTKQGPAGAGAWACGNPAAELAVPDRRLAAAGLSSWLPALTLFASVLGTTATSNEQ